MDQKAMTLTSGRQSYCKHVARCLRTVIDPEAEVAVERAKSAKLAAELEVKQAQDTELPGERERLQYALKKLSAGEVVEHLMSHMRSGVDELRAVAKVFSASEFPARQTQHCYRCDKDFDTRYEPECAMPHPASSVERTYVMQLPFLFNSITHVQVCIVVRQRAETNRSQCISPFYSLRIAQYKCALL
jgi:hypothetical protein